MFLDVLQLGIRNNPSFLQDNLRIILFVVNAITWIYLAIGGHQFGLVILYAKAYTQTRI